MRRTLRLFIWEIINPLVLLVFLAGLILGFMGTNSTLLHAYSIKGGVSGIGVGGKLVHLYGYPLSTSGNALQNVLNQLPKAGFGSYYFVIMLLGVLIFRYDRDMGYSSTIYSLPYRKSKIFLVKLLSLLVLSFMLLFLPLFIDIFLSNATIAASVLGMVSKRAFLISLFLVVGAIFYLDALTALLSILLRGMFQSLIAVFIVVYLSQSISSSKLPPFNLISSALTPNLNRVTPSMLFSALILPLMLVVVGLLIAERRDVV